LTRKEFISQAGKSAALLLVPACISGLSACKKKNKVEHQKVDFTLDVSSGPLATKGGSLVHEDVIVARALSGAFLAVSAACTHQQTTINFVSSSTSFLCPNHGSKFNSNGEVTQGPASKNLTSYGVELSGSTLRVFEA
jgi:cytochrome b6-f complex iron-sulfur subunit